MRTIFIFSLVSIFLFESCTNDGLSDVSNTQLVFFNQLSEYQIYAGDPSALIPSFDYIPYELGSTLFTDFAEKQRLIKIPPNTQMEKIDDGLPAFPDGTIIVKTFYYYHDKRDIIKGKRIIETRLLIKESGEWNVADYLWNDNQTDAILIEDGLNTTVNYINEAGQPKVLAYHVPSIRECATCHLKGDDLIPIGPKLRNLNISIVRSNGAMNQISFLQDLDMINDFDPTNMSSMPDYHDSSISTQLRARAYLDINCGHCHFKDGFAANTNLLMNYEMTLEESNIMIRKADIIENLSNGKMPYLGTSVLDEDGIGLIKEYIKSL